jgi:hypothetical protein
MALNPTETQLVDQQDQVLAQAVAVVHLQTVPQTVGQEQRVL